MMGTLILLVPLVPYGTLRLAEPDPGPTVTAPVSVTPKFPLHPQRPPGAFGDPDTEGPSSPLSDRAVRAAARGWEWKRLESPRWKILASDNFALRGDVPIDDLRAAATYLEEFYRMLRTAVGGRPKGVEFSVRIFRNPADFRRYACRAGAPNAESFYDPRTQEVVLCLDPKRGRLGLQRTLAHEFVHGYMDLVWDRTSPLWFAEGMAEYFSNFEIREGRAQPGGVDQRAMLLLTIEPPVPLKEFTRLGRAEFYGIRFVHLYAQAWAFVHYLFSRNDGMIDLLLRGKGVVDPDTLEQEWKAYLEKISR